MFFSAIRNFVMRTMGVGGFLCLATMAVGQDTNFAQGPQYLSLGNPQFAQAIATPSMAVDGTYPSLQAGASNGTAGNVVGANLGTLAMEPEGDLVDLYTVYYGYPPLDLFVGAPEEGGPVPSTGVSRNGMGRVTTPEDLRRSGYGVTLAEAAHYWKAHPRHAQRVFTNEDIQRITRSN